MSAAAWYTFANETDRESLSHKYGLFRGLWHTMNSPNYVLMTELLEAAGFAELFPNDENRDRDLRMVWILLQKPEFSEGNWFDIARRLKSALSFQSSGVPLNRDQRFAGSVFLNAAMNFSTGFSSHILTGGEESFANGITQDFESDEGVN